MLPAAVARYQREYPGMKVRVLDGIGPGTARFVLNGEAEFGVVLVDNEPGDRLVEPMLADPYVLACHEDHPPAGMDAVRWSDLPGHAYLRMGPGTGNERVLSRELESLGLLPDWVLEAQHVSTLMAFIEVNLGVSAVTGITVGQLGGRRIVTRPLIEPVVKRRIGVLDAPERSLNPAALALRAIVVDELERFGQAGADEPGRGAGRD